MPGCACARLLAPEHRGVVPASLFAHTQHKHWPKCTHKQWHACTLARRRVGRTGRAGDKEGVAYTLLVDGSSRDAHFAGLLVNSLTLGGQEVPGALAGLAMKVRQRIWLLGALMRRWPCVGKRRQPRVTLLAQDRGETKICVQP